MIKAARAVFVFLLSLILIVPGVEASVSEVIASPDLIQTSGSTADSLIPKPVSVEQTGGTFTLTADTTIFVPADFDDAAAVGQFLADTLRPATGFELVVIPVADEDVGVGIRLDILENVREMTPEAYNLSVTAEGVLLSSATPEGLFRGVQTIRQLLPPSIERDEVQAESWTMPTVEIRDYPRFEWRGAMLDVSRHFFGVDVVKRYIDLMAYYKMNRLHLHLSDDQGWRIAIPGWERLTEIGGSTEVGGGEGGYYTQEDYTEIVNYAAAHYIVIIPEIDMPGHTNAALASYAELNCDDVARELYTGIEVGFSSLCINKDITYDFVDDVVREIAAITPGPYFHIGGDESHATETVDYLTFVERVQDIVASHGKQIIGWEEIAQAELNENTIVQHWNSRLAADGVEQGAKVIMSPAQVAYLDMKYDATTPIGLSWAAFIEVETAYDWDPATRLNGVTEENIIGVEAPLWSETLEDLSDIEYMAFPRILGYAEMGWSQQADRVWDDYRVRLGAHGPRLRALGVGYYESDSVNWE